MQAKGLKSEIDIHALFKKLVENYEDYFSHDVMNSEGRKIFRQFARCFLEVYPQHKPMLARIRREPTFQNVMKLSKLLNIKISRTNCFNF